MRIFLKDSSLLYPHLNLKLRRKENSHVSIIVVANLLIKTNYFDIIGESLNLRDLHLLK